MRVNPLKLGMVLFVLGIFSLVFPVREAYEVEIVTGWMPVDVDGDGQPDYLIPEYGWETKYRTVFPLRWIGIFMMYVGFGILAIAKFIKKEKTES